MFMHSRRWLTAATMALTLLGCDQQRIDALEEGVSTEAEVRAQFGQPTTIWPEADGARTFEYNRQPQGNQNYMITIGPDGTMTALRQVLAPHVFEQVRPRSRCVVCWGSQPSAPPTISSRKPIGIGAGWTLPPGRWYSPSPLAAMAGYCAQAVGSRCQKGVERSGLWQGFAKLIA